MKGMGCFIVRIFFGSCLFVPIGTENDLPGNVHLPDCKDKINIHEETNNTIVCQGFNPRDTIVWRVDRDDQNTMAVATCEPFNCTVHLPGAFAVTRVKNESHLFYQQDNRTSDYGAQVVCESHYKSKVNKNICQMNVISPAILSECKVEEVRMARTLTGSCRFEHAFSYSKGFTCHWYQVTPDKSRVTYTGVITGKQEYTGVNGNKYMKGWCEINITKYDFEEGIYSYSIDFFPGVGEETVSSNGRLTGDSGTSPSSTTTNNLSTSPQEPAGENSIPVGAIVGGLLAAVAVIIIIVVVVIIVVFRRKRTQKPAGSAHWSNNRTSEENDDFEEHVNPMNVTSGDPDGTHSTDHNPAIAPRISSGTKNDKNACPDSLDADLYTTVDGEVDNNVDSATNGTGDGFGGYEDIRYGSNQHVQGRRADEYAVVDKSKAHNGPASAASLIAFPAHTTEGSDEYAVVDKSSPRNKENKATNNVSPGLPTSDTNNAGADVYAQVNKSGKTDKAFEPETEGAAYAQVQKPKPAAKPAKLSSKTDVSQRGAADDDEYHTLSHTRGSPHTQGQGDSESHYSHI